MLYYKGRFNAFDFRVEQVTKHKVGYHSEPGESRMYYLRLDDVHPIRLTPELLERWGFVTKDEPGHWTGYRSYSFRDENGKCFMLRWYEKDEVCEISLNAAPYWIRFKYLHQLQQLMQSCGFDKEMKIKKG